MLKLPALIFNPPTSITIGILLRVFRFYKGTNIFLINIE